MEASLQIFFRVEFFFPSEWFPPRVRLFMGMETVIFLIEALRKTKISNDYLDVQYYLHIKIKSILKGIKQMVNFIVTFVFQNIGTFLEETFHNFLCWLPSDIPVGSM